LLTDSSLTGVPLTCRHTVCDKLAALRGACILRNGGLIAHQTATLAGIAAATDKPAALQLLTRFKQRRGPFLLLADDLRTAARLSRYFSSALRRQMRASWPGPVTLVFSGRPGLPASCYHHGLLAVRVDASLQVRQLAHASGGLLLSSSLNRQGCEPLQPDIKTQMRFHRYLDGRVSGTASTGKASAIIRIKRKHLTIIR